MTARILGMALLLLLSISTAHAGEAQHVDASGAHDLLAKNADVVVLDVRSAGEFGPIRIDRSSAVNIDVDGGTFRDEVAKLDRDETYLVHCAAGIPGGRSERAVKVMEELGFRDVHHLDGGINAWKDEGFEVTGSAVK